MSNTAPEQIGDLAKQAVAEIRAKQADPEKYRPVPFAIKDLDTLVGGAVMPSYIAIGGPAKIGKTALAIHMALALGRSGRAKILTFHLEELKSQYAIRAMTTLTDSADRVKIRNLTLTEEDLAELDVAAEQLQSVQLWVEDKTYAIDRILGIAQEAKADVIIIDTFNLVEGGGSGDDWKRLENLSKMFLRARNDRNLTVIIIYQMNDTGRAFGTRQPYRDADLIMEVEDVKDDSTKEVIPGVLRIRIRPSRQAPEGHVDVAFDGAHSRIRDLQIVSLDLDKAPTSLDESELEQAILLPGG